MGSAAGSEVAMEAMEVKIGETTNIFSYILLMFEYFPSKFLYFLGYGGGLGGGYGSYGGYHG